VNVDLEDIEFNNKFQVYSNNEVEAFYILTPNMIGKIKEIERELKGGLLLVFNNNQLHIGIKNNKQTFTPSLFINVHKFVDSCYRDVKTVMKLVDLLELDNDLFKVDTTISSN
jgi:mRNA deadenylase 3'-5' endonuclease subunit Ccr4